MDDFSLRATTLTELLSHYDERFVRCAYHTLLGRAPDPDGLQYYLSRVRAGFYRTEILAQIRLSAEGRQRHLNIAGLDGAIWRIRLLKTPVLGALLRPFLDHIGVRKNQQHLRAIENRFYGFIDNAQQSLETQLPKLEEYEKAFGRHMDKLVKRCEEFMATDGESAFYGQEIGQFVRREAEDLNNSAGVFTSKNAATCQVTKVTYFDVVFAIGCWEGESKRYRVHNVAEGLIQIGYKVDVIPFERIATLAENRIKAHTVVLFRAPFDSASRVEIFLGYAKLNNIKVVFDVDDLIFEPDIIDQIDGFRFLSAEEKKNYVTGVHAYRKLLLACDMVTVPTEYLRERALALGQSTFVIPNSINAAQMRIADELVRDERKNDRAIRIGYFSGSRTHQADFAECADALFDVMSTHSNIELRIVGFLELDDRWSVFRSRIERMDFQPYQSMLRTLNECDINIAPLDLSSVFCHGKSELKFFEAGLVGIPTVASASDTYARVIENGTNGFSVKTSKEWRESLEALIASEKLRKSMGEKAKETAIGKFAFCHIAEHAAKVYGLRTIPKSLNVSIKSATVPSHSRLRIAWVIPELIIGGGGHRNILRAAYFLSKFGHDIKLYFTGTSEAPNSIKRKIQEHFYPLDCPVHLFSGTIDAADVVVATHWSTVEAALIAGGVAKVIMYFVQDFEPAFAPMSSEYVLAENTYRLGLYHITSGPWCEAILRRDFGAEADHFQFPIDTSIYFPRARTKPNKNLIFFAKPEMPRRCFELGVMALRTFHHLQPNVEIVMFGSKNIRTQSYDFPVTIRDVLPTLEDLAEMYSNGDVGLVFSTTNPSLIPYEMMACGLPVVDLARGDNAVNYGGRSDIALLADTMPEKMASQIAQLVSNKLELVRRRANGLDFVGQFPSEEEMAKRVEYLIDRRVRGEAINRLND